MERSTESPMDFQFDDPMRLDPSSPFAFAAMSQQRTNSSTGTGTAFASSDGTSRPSSQPLDSTTLNDKRVDQRDALRKRPFEALGPSANAKEQSPPFLFSTPHYKSLAGQFRAAHEQSTPSSAEADRFADTEDTPKDDVRRSRFEMGDHTATGALRRVKRRRERLPRERKFWKGRGIQDNDVDMDDDDDDDDDGAAFSASKSSQRALGWRERHKEIPFIASSYLQLFFNILLLLVILYLMFAFVSTIQRDVDQKVEEYSTEILQEMAICSKEYLENRCDPSQRVPAMEKACTAWEKCMNRDPSVVGRARVSAETFAEIVNSFIEPISYKTMIFCLLLVFGSLFFSNFAFGFLRAKAVEHPHPLMAAAIPPMMQIPPAYPTSDYRGGRDWHRRALQRSSSRSYGGAHR